MSGKRAVLALNQGLFYAAREGAWVRVRPRLAPGRESVPLIGRAVQRVSATNRHYKAQTSSAARVLVDSLMFAVAQ